MNTRLGASTSTRPSRSLARIPISLHCWQGDDVGGFETAGAATRRRPGGHRQLSRARPARADELRADLDKALSLIPGKHRLNLHAIYAESGGRSRARRARSPSISSAGSTGPNRAGLGLDFNPTFFAHPKAADGFTLSHRDEGIRKFWIDHGIACRQIGAAMGKALGTPCVTNVWIPDGYKDTPVDRKAPRERLASSLDDDLRRAARSRSTTSTPSRASCSASARRATSSARTSSTSATRSRARSSLCLDAGHFHPTETSPTRSPPCSPT